MELSKAEQFLTELATLMEHRLDPKRREMMARMMTDLSDGVAEEAFRVLAFRCKRFPTLAEIREAFEAAQREIEAQGTYETARSRPVAPESEQRLRRSVQKHLEFEIVAYYPDLYASFLDALREYRSGRRTWEELEMLRSALIQQARARGVPGRFIATDRQAGQDAKASSESGIAASLPRGDRE